MVKPKRPSATASLHRTPAPPANLIDTFATMTWPKGQVIHRIHLAIYGADQFNPGLRGNARFSPIKNLAGAPIPTLYGGDSLAGATMETVFHDVPYGSGLKTFDKGKLVGQVYSQLAPQQDLALADLTATALRRLGVQPTQLIETEKDQYPATRLWAEAIHAVRPDVQGLCWVSRQDDRARALVLFGDRLPADALAPRGGSLDILANVDVYSALITLADRIGVKLVAGRA